jgi:hypothetical protein
VNEYASGNLNSHWFSVLEYWCSPKTLRQVAQFAEQTLKRRA